ncbi:MAG: phosphopyruvate hydratase [Lachnospiraceae bacterium]|nr:phosphopyruvate hydratase [Lachnospiraceae bacterium]
MITIEKIYGREILDSRGNPTIEAKVILSDSTIGTGCAPSGASTGEYEALELRDNNKKRYNKKGVEKAVENINNKISSGLCGFDAYDINALDNAMLKIDGTNDKSKLGANSILAVSIACAYAAATSQKIPLYKFLGGINAITLPVPMMNILNGGMHASNTVDTQEFMIMPVGASSFKEGLQWCSEVYHNLAKILSEKSYSTTVGDEGGFAPNLTGDIEAIELIISAIEKSNYKLIDDFVIAIDAASSEWKSDKGCGYYTLPKSGVHYTSEELIEYWSKLIEKYPIFSIEDPLDENDWEGWQKITHQLGNKMQLVGDDLFVTNINRLSNGLESKCANSILIKPNQIGTISETLSTIRLAQKNNYSTISSHRSGETTDTFISDLAVGLNMGQIKSGAPCRGERIAKYNRLLQIEEELGNTANYIGKNLFSKFN